VHRLIEQTSYHIISRLASKTSHVVTSTLRNSRISLQKTNTHANDKLRAKVTPDFWRPLVSGGGGGGTIPLGILSGKLRLHESNKPPEIGKSKSVKVPQQKSADQTFQTGGVFSTGHQHETSLTSPKERASASGWSP
jgi:hypothetical protein